MNLLNQYRGLRKEVYVLFFGRVVTNLGAMVWPLLTLIMNQKLGMSASLVAVVSVIASALVELAHSHEFFSIVPKSPVTLSLPELPSVWAKSGETAVSAVLRSASAAKRMRNVLPSSVPASGARRVRRSIVK